MVVYYNSIAKNVQISYENVRNSYIYMNEPELPTPTANFLQLTDFYIYSRVIYSGDF